MCLMWLPYGVINYNNDVPQISSVLRQRSAVHRHSAAVPHSVVGQRSVEARRSAVARSSAASRSLDRHRLELGPHRRRRRHSAVVRRLGPETVAGM